MSDPVVPFPAGGPDAVKRALDNAAPVTAIVGADHDGARWGGGGRAGLPEGCPVTPLGVSGMLCFYLDELQQLIDLAAKDHSHNNIKKLFGRKSSLLYEYWPRMDKEGAVKGWRPEEGGESLMKAAAEKGPIDLFDRVREAGAWLGDDGELVLHCGDGVLAGDTWRGCGVLGRHVYPATAPKPRPARSYARGGSGGPADDLLAMLKTWNWRRPEVDPLLLLGWIGAAMVGGALAWRPAAWITGDRATGKSTLHELLKLVFDEGGLFSLSDASQAGITQYVRHSSLPVAIDELEPSDDNRRAQAIINLARLAASGGQMARGGADHTAKQFTIRFCLLFSSILIPPLAPQDRSRLAVLELDPLDGGPTGPTKAPTLDRRWLRACGAALRRRLVDQWPRFAATLDAYRHALAEAGHSGRGADQFGTLLACQDVLLHDSAPDSDSLAEWAERLRAAAIAERGDDLADHERCLAHLTTSIVDPYRGGARRTIGQWMADAVDPDEQGVGNNKQPAVANAVLETYGVKIVAERGPLPGDAALWWVYVSNSHQGLAQLYRETHWGGSSGKSAPYVQALRRVPDAQASGNPHPTARFGQVSTRYTRVPLERVLPDLTRR